MRDTKADKKAPPYQNRRGCKCLAKTLERNLASDLPVSWKLLTDRLPKRPISQVGIHKQIGMIKQIVELKPQLEIDPLSDPCVLVRGQIRLGETWLPEQIVQR